MITVQAPSRLHFGLFHLGEETHWPNREGQPALRARQFGGVGLMVQEPGLQVSVRPAASWSAEGPLAERALQYAHGLAAKVLPPLAVMPRRIVVDRSPPEHVGLGTGTQLALTVSRGLLTSFGLPWQEKDAASWASLLGRGARSALGIHGFNYGGFLVEGGKPAHRGDIAPLLYRADFPRTWRILLAMPARIRGLHGSGERQAFAWLREQHTSLATTDALCRLVLLGMLPALIEQDCQAFGEALYDFNRRVGERFAPVQGGPYAHPQLSELVQFVRQQGIAGVGQSSWGSTIFAVVPDEGTAQHLAQQMRQRFDLAESEVICTAACNSGATVELR